MARSVVLFASSVVVATCCACFHLVVAAADDRQARSGDLDRGPPPLPPPNTPTPTESRNFPGKNQEALSRKPSGPSPSSSSPGQNSPSKNLEAFSRKPPSSNPSPSHPWKSDSTFDLVRKWNFNYERSPRSSAPDTPTTSSYYVGKIISGYPAQNWDLGRRGDSTLVSPSKSSKSASAGPASSNYSNETDSTPSSSHENPHRLILAMERRLEMSTEFFLVPPPPNPPNNPPTGNSPGSPVGHITKTACSGCPVETDRIAGIFRNEPWVIPVLTLSCITMVLIIGFEVFVLCKAWRTTPSRRHLFLGQMLLLGLFTCAGLGAVYAASPTQLTCAVVRFGTGVSYAIVFASLLVKCVFLISLNGGVYLPAPYQGLLLLFAILIQVAIGAQWLLTSPPLVDSITVENIVTQTTKHRLLVTAEDIASPTSVPLCRTTYTDILLSLIYVIFLILFVTVLAVKSRGIRDNYREATYIGLSVGCSIPTWLIWILSGFIVSERHRDACIAFGLVISSVLVFLIMFMPKGRQLAAMGKEGVYVEDREERFSSLSRAGSGYSPSFFHFKPMKYGLGGHGTTHKHHQHTITTIGGGGVFLRPDDGNVYTTLEPTLSSNPNVYFQRGNGLHPGMMY